MNRAKLNLINRPRVKVRAAEDFTSKDRELFYTECKAWGEIKGFKAGWAMVQFKERFGWWPPWSRRDIAPAVNVGSETMAYISARKREWAKERKKERKAEEQRRADMGEMSAPKDDWIELGEYRV